MIFNTGHAILLSFSIFLFLSYRFGFEKLKNLLDDQIKKIKKRIDSARLAKEEAFGALNLQRRRNLQLSTEVEEILRDAQEEVYQIRQKFLDDFEKIKVSRTQLAHASLDQFRQDILESYKTEVIHLSVLAFSQLLKDHVTSKQHQILNQIAIHEIDKKLQECR